MRHSLIHTPSLCFGKSVDCVFHTWCDLLCRNRSGTTFFGAWVSLRTFFTEGKMSEFGFLNLGYNNEGYNKKGFDRQGYDRDGYNKFGFNKEGFNRKGFDKYGYDRTGFDEQGYNASGFDKSGYDKQGYDKDGYDRLGRDRQGYDKTGYDINGFDRFGFDGSGYNRDGYDRNGLNHDGYDKYGYDVNGFDTTGYNRLGYDKFGFNCNGFNKFGFDRDGYNKDGFNKDGFNRDGFGRDGYNYSGFDKFGFDRQGYDKSGYNKDGFNRDGYTADGYNIYGYDRFGYDKNGFNSKGINKAGINVWGYDLSWYDGSGFNPLGYDKKGYDEFGFDKNGFNIQGVDQFGHHKEEFDSDGFHKITGFNRFGFNREGFNINGIAPTGKHASIDSDIVYDNNGYSSDGMPKSSFNAASFLTETQSGAVSKTQHVKTDKNDLEVGDIVYHRDLGEAVIKELKLPYCTVVFMKTNVKMTFRLFDDYLSINPSEKVIELNASFEEEDYDSESKHLDNTLLYLKNTYSLVLKTSINKKWTELANLDKKQVVDNSGFISTYTPDYSDKAEHEFEMKMSNLTNSPYFARVRKGDDDFYIGKNGTDTIVDWQSPKCKFYYQYQIYIGIPSEKLGLVRDFTIQKSKFFGYIDKYNDGVSSSDYKKYADEHLKKIIRANRDNKGIHDIITSIQQNQYEIMIEDGSKNLLVVGCAGSGKTMIMLHRISYLLYNDTSISPSNIFVLSPTKHLSFESSVLSKTLNLGEIHKLTVADMYKHILESYNSKYAVNYCFDKEIKIHLLQGEALKYSTFYSSDFTKNFIEKIAKILDHSTDEYKGFIMAYSSELNKNQKQYLDLFNDNDYFYALKQQIESFIDLCKNGSVRNRKEKGYSLDDVAKILAENRRLLKGLESLYKFKLIIEYFLQNNCFIGHEVYTAVEKSTSVDDIAENCKQYFPFLNVVLSNFELVEAQLASQCSNRTKAIESILNTLYIHGKITNKSEVLNIFEWLRTTSTKNANAYLALINKVLQQNEDISFKISVLEDLKNNGWLFACHSNDEKYATPDENAFLKNILPVYKALEFDESTGRIGEQFKIHSSIGSLFDFFKSFNVLCLRQKELDSFIANGDRSIIPNLISFNLGDYDCKEEYKIKHDYQAFVHCSVMNALYGALSQIKIMVCIDEFQDLSMKEISLLKSVYPNASFNFYGDFKQCITMKGDLTQNSIVSMFPNIQIYTINENYRNAMEITNYINQFFGVNMRPVGINGAVEKIRYSNYSNFKFENGDRIAYIAKDHEHLNYSFMSQFGVLEGWKGKQSEQVPANAPIALSVQEVKGLEFEVVILDFMEMTENEKYVAATRALNKLYIIE